MSYSRTSHSTHSRPRSTPSSVKPVIAKPNLKRPIFHSKEAAPLSDFAIKGFNKTTGGRRRSKSQKRNRKQRRRTRRH
jgi:hypothetical protein